MGSLASSATNPAPRCGCCWRIRTTTTASIPHRSRASNTVSTLGPNTQPDGGSRRRQATDGTEYGTREDGTRYRRDPYPDPAEPATIRYSEYRFAPDGTRHHTTVDGTEYRTDPDGNLTWKQPGHTEWQPFPLTAGRQDPTIPRGGGVIAVDLKHLPKFGQLHMSGAGAHGLYDSDHPGPKAGAATAAPAEEAPSVAQDHSDSEREETSAYTVPTRWDPVRDSADPAFTTLARILNLPDAGAVRDEVYERLLIMGRNEAARRVEIEDMRRRGWMTAASEAKEQEHHRRTNEWIVHARRLVAPDPTLDPEPSDLLRGPDAPLEVAARALRMNVVSVHPDGRTVEFISEPARPTVFVRHTADGGHEVGVTAEGNLFTATSIPRAPARLRTSTVGVPLDRIPPPFDRVLAAPHTPLLDGAAIDKKYAAENRPIAAKSSIEALAKAHRFDETDTAPAYFTPVGRMSPEELESHRLFVGPGGRLYRASDGMPFDTTAARSARLDDGNRRAIFVMDEFGNLYAGDQEFGVRHHSSFLGGRIVTAAGEMEVRDGVLVLMSDRSGHYLPRPEINDYALDLLRSQGLTLDDRFIRVDHENMPRNRFGELDRQRAEVARRQIVLNAAVEALVRRERTLGRPHADDGAPQQDTARDIVEHERETLTRRQSELNHWRRELASGNIQKALQDQTLARPAPRDPGDRITPPQPPRGLGDTEANARERADWWREHGRNWWDTLRFEGIDPGYQSGLLAGYPGLRNGDGIPAPVRDTLNRTFIQLEIARLTALADLGPLPSSGDRQLRNLRGVLTDLHTADLEATIAARRSGIAAPPVRLLSFDQDAKGRAAAAIIALGPVDTAGTVRWHASRDAALGSMHDALTRAAQQHADIAHTQPGHATVLSAHTNPTASRSQSPARLLKRSFGSLRETAPDRLGAAVAAFAEARRADTNNGALHHIQLHTTAAAAESAAPHLDPSLITVDETDGARATPSWETVPATGNQLFDALSRLHGKATPLQLRTGLADRLEHDPVATLRTFTTPRTTQAAHQEQTRRAAADADLRHGRLTPAQQSAEATRRHRFDRQFEQFRRDELRGLIDTLRDPHAKIDRLTGELLPLTARAYGLNLVLLRTGQVRTILHHNPSGAPFLMMHASADGGTLRVAMGGDGAAYAVPANQLHTPAAFGPAVDHPSLPPLPFGPRGGDERGVRMFDTDSQERQFGATVLNRWHELTPNQQHAVWAHTGDPLPNQLLRYGESALRDAVDDDVDRTRSRGASFTRYLGLPPGVDAVRHQIALMDQAIDRPLPHAEPFHATRVLHDLGSLLGPDRAPLGTRDPRLLAGTTQSDPGYTSTTVGGDPVPAAGDRPAPARLNLMVPVGAHGLWVDLRTIAPDATALLFPRGMRYRINSVTRDPATGSAVLNAEILGEPS